MGLQNVDTRIKVITLLSASAHYYRRLNSLIPRNLDSVKEPKRAIGKGTLYYQPNNKILTTDALRFYGMEVFLISEFCRSRWDPIFNCTPFFLNESGIY